MATDTKFVRGATKLSRRIATIRENLALPLLMEETKGILVRRTLQRFEREVDPDERPWKPLKESTLKRKQSGFGGQKMLQRTEAMKNSIRAIRGGLGTTFTNTGAGFRIGIDDPDIVVYAKIQNRGNGRIPARRFLGIGALDIKAVDSLLRSKATQLESL